MLDDRFKLYVAGAFGSDCNEGIKQMMTKLPIWAFCPSELQQILSDMHFYFSN